MSIHLTNYGNAQISILRIDCLIKGLLLSKYLQYLICNVLKAVTTESLNKLLILAISQNEMPFYLNFLRASQDVGRSEEGEQVVPAPEHQGRGERRARHPRNRRALPRLRHARLGMFIKHCGFPESNPLDLNNFFL